MANVDAAFRDVKFSWGVYSLRTVEYIPEKIYPSRV